MNRNLSMKIAGSVWVVLGILGLHYFAFEVLRLVIPLSCPWIAILILILFWSVLCISFGYRFFKEKHKRYMGIIVSVILVLICILFVYTGGVKLGILYILLAVILFGFGVLTLVLLLRQSNSPVVQEQHNNNG